MRKKPVGTIWPRIGALVGAARRARHRRVAVLVAGALGNLKDRGTLDFSEQFREPPESVEGLRSLQAKFPPGQAGPVDIVVDAAIARRRRCRRSASDVAYSVDLVGFSRDEQSWRSSASRSTRTRSPRWRPTRSRSCARTRATAQRPDRAGRRPDGRGAGLRDRACAATRKLIVPLALALVLPDRRRRCCAAWSRRST